MSLLREDVMACWPSKEACLSDSQKRHIDKGASWNAPVQRLTGITCTIDHDSWCKKINHSYKPASIICIIFIDCELLGITCDRCRKIWGKWVNQADQLCFIQLSEQLVASGHLIELEDGLGLMCVTCGAVKKSSFAKFVEHLETMHHFGRGYPCPLCEKMSWSQSNRQRHIERAHKKSMSFRQIRDMMSAR